MIYVNRNNVTEPDSLKVKDGPGDKERVQVLLFYNDPLNFSSGAKFVKYSAYKSDDVKKQLKSLFNGKCAYCEEKIVVVTNPDIEHFRPKGRIRNAKKTLKPGYYWLASNWENLLLSCPNCNRKNTFEIVNVGKVTIGKHDQFPISNEKHRLRKPTDNFQNEESVRLLLNPCIDKPEQHLYFKDNGLIIPKKKGKGISKKGINSIEVYALQRKDLVDEREALIKKIKAQIISVDRCVDHQNSIGKGADAKIDKWVEDEVESLLLFLLPKERFQAVARQYIGSFMWKKFGIRI